MDPLEMTPRWWRRAQHPSAAGAPLGFGAELWRADVDDFESTPALRARFEELGRPIHDEDLAYHLTGHLLEDVLVAAGGVERALIKLRAARKNLVEYVATNPLADGDSGEYGVSSSATVEAWYAFVDLVVWTRTLRERLTRAPAPGSRLPDQGLIPALNEGKLRNSCDAAVRYFDASPAGQARHLANFVLHSALVAHPASGAWVEADGVVTLPIPNLPATRVSNWYTLRWSARLDGFEYAEHLWSAVCRTVDSILESFEDNLPPRLRRGAVPTA